MNGFVASKLSLSMDFKYLCLFFLYCIAISSCKNNETVKVYNGIVGYNIEQSGHYKSKF